MQIYLRYLEVNIYYQIYLNSFFLLKLLTLPTFSLSSSPPEFEKGSCSNFVGVTFTYYCRNKNICNCLYFKNVI